MIDVLKMFGAPPRMDYDAHNREVKEVIDSYDAGNPVRMPMTVSSSVRIILCNPDLNPDGITFEAYSNDPELMMQMQIAHQYYVRHFMPQDVYMGDERPYTVSVDFQNYYEAAWLGAPLAYPENNVPCSLPFVTDDNKREFVSTDAVFDNDFMRRNFRYGEYMRERCENMEFRGAKVRFGNVNGFGTDGPMTVACNIRGTTEFCIDMYEDEGFANDLLDYITDATILRITSLREKCGVPTPDGYGFADDSILLLSASDYRKFILPRHKRLAAALSTQRLPASIHLCGDVQRHLKILHDELNVHSFDTGYPISFREMYEQLGGDIKVRGGVPVSILRDGAPGDVRRFAERVIGEVTPLTKLFKMGEANNLAPCTPLENIAAMYDAAKRCEYK